MACEFTFVGRALGDRPIPVVDDVLGLATTRFPAARRDRVVLSHVHTTQELHRFDPVAPKPATDGNCVNETSCHLVTPRARFEQRGLAPSRQPQTRRSGNLRPPLVDKSPDPSCPSAGHRKVGCRNARYLLPIPALWGSTESSDGFGFRAYPSDPFNAVALAHARGSVCGPRRQARPATRRSRRGRRPAPAGAFRARMR